MGDDISSARESVRSADTLRLGVKLRNGRVVFLPRTALPGGNAAAGGDNGYDFTILDQLLPPPVYGKTHWDCVLNPGTTTIESVRQPLTEAYEMVVARPARNSWRVFTQRVCAREMISAPRRA